MRASPSTSQSPSAPSRARPSCPPRPPPLPNNVRTTPVAEAVRCQREPIRRPPGTAGVPPARPAPAAPAFTLRLNAARQDCPVPAGGALLLDVLAANGITYRLATRAWRDPAFVGEPLLV